MRRVVVGGLLVMLAGARADVAAAAHDPGPRFDFMLNCSGCHGMDAAGSATVPALTGTGALLATAEGRDYLIRVPGVAQSPLTDERLAALMNWMLAEIGGAALPAAFTAEEVGRLRSDPLRDPAAARGNILVKNRVRPHFSDAEK